MTHLIITPTYNERGNIRTLVERLFALYPAIHVLVVDDASPDGTASVVRELQQTYPGLHLKERSGKLGLASAYLSAFRDMLAEHPELEAIITMDADLSHEPAVVSEMLTALGACDLVIGSRYIRGGGTRGWSLWRRLLSQGGNLYARLVIGSGVHDLTGGFNAYRTALLRRYNLDAVHAEGYGFQMEMKIIAKRLGAHVCEIPIIFPDRTEGVSKISNSIIYEGLLLPWRFSPIARFFRSKGHA